MMLNHNMHVPFIREFLDNTHNINTADFTAQEHYESNVHQRSIPNFHNQISARMLYVCNQVFYHGL